MMQRCLNCMDVYDEQYDICPFCGYMRGTPPEVSSHLIPGTILGDRYIIGTVIGQGGFGITYCAWDEDMGVKLAIKEYYPNGLVNRSPGTNEVIVLGEGKQKLFLEGKQRFLQEARTMAKFGNNPNIVHAYGFFEDNNTAYIVMEYLDGPSLKEYVTQFSNQIMPIDDAIQIVTEVGKALSAIHKEKVVHRDIAPDNIKLCTDGKIKLIDFGAARLSTGEESLSLTVELKLGYAPIEQYRKKSKQGPKTDIYALAATLYKLLTGVLPLESCDRVIEDTLKKPSEINDKVPDWLDSVIMTGMAINAEARFSSVAKFVDALSKNKAVKYPEQRIKIRRWTRSASIIIIALAISAVGYCYFGMYSDISGEGVPNGEITMWVAVSSDNDQNRYEEFEKAFEKKYNKKYLKVKFIDDKDYKRSINEALEKGTAPTIFIGNYVKKRNYSCKADVKGLMRDIPMRHIFSLKENSKMLENRKQIPVGMNIYVLYENTYLSRDAQVSFVEENGAELDNISSKSDLFNGEKTKTRIKSFSKIAYSKNAQEEFLNEKIVFYIGSIAEKSEIQKKLGGYSDVTSITYDGVSKGIYKDYLSINAKSKKTDQKIAQLLIKYAICEEGQNVLCIRNQGIMPINKKAFRTYIDINSSLSFVDLSKVNIIN